MKNTPLTIWTFVSQVMSLPFNTLSRFVIAFLPRSKCLLITIFSDFGAQKSKVWHCFHCFPIYFPWSDGTRCHQITMLCVSGTNIVLWTKLLQLCPTLYDPMDCGPPVSTVHGIPQARILEWVAIPFSRGSSLPRDWTLISGSVGRQFTVWATREAII